jgi:hypothetical protein
MPVHDGVQTTHRAIAATHTFHEKTFNISAVSAPPRQKEGRQRGPMGKLHPMTTGREKKITDASLNDA